MIRDEIWETGKGISKAIIRIDLGACKDYVKTDMEDTERFWKVENYFL